MSTPDVAWPVGAVFLSVLATDPSVTLGFGTWQAIGSGRVLVGFNQADPDFDALEETGGAKTVAATGSNSAPAFTGTASQVTSATSAGTPAGTNSAPAFTGNAVTAASTTNGTKLMTANTSTGVSPITTATGTVAAPVFTGSALSTHTHTLTPAGTVAAPAFTGSASSVVQPYFVVNMWKRTA